MTAPTRPVHILGFSFDLRQPYAAGHSCSAAEAATLNRMLVRGTSKGLHKALCAALEGLGAAVLSASGLSADERALVQQRGEEYVADFALGFANGHDVQRSVRLEADRLARQLLEAKYNASGRSIRDLDISALGAQLSELASSEKVQLEAKRRVSVTQEIAERAADELLGSGVDGADA